MDHSRHTPLGPQELNAAILTDATVYDAEDNKVGTISHVHGTGAATDVVIDVGGFLGLGSKPVLVGIDQITLMRDEAGTVHGVTAWTKDQLKALPEHRH